VYLCIKCFEKGFKMKFFERLLSKIPGTDEYATRQIKEQTHNAVARNGSDAVFLAKMCDGIETVCPENGVYRYHLKNIKYAFDAKYVLEKNGAYANIEMVKDICGNNTAYLNFYTTSAENDALVSYVSNNYKNSVDQEWFGNQITNLLSEKEFKTQKSEYLDDQEIQNNLAENERQQNIALELKKQGDALIQAKNKETPVELQQQDWWDNEVQEMEKLANAAMELKLRRQGYAAAARKRKQELKAEREKETPAQREKRLADAAVALELKKQKRLIREQKRLQKIQQQLEWEKHATPAEIMHRHQQDWWASEKRRMRKEATMLKKQSQSLESNSTEPDTPNLHQKYITTIGLFRQKILSKSASL